MRYLYFRHLVCLVCLSLLPITSYANPGMYQVDTSPAKEAKVFTDFSKNEGTNNFSYGYDPYGTYLPGFPSMNDNGDIAGRASFTYVDPHSGEETTQWEAAVWIEGKIHRFGVFICNTSNCQSRALNISNSRDRIVGSSHGSVGGTTPYFERSIMWSVDDGAWYSQYNILDNNIQSYVEDVNNQGNVVGSAIVAQDYIRHAQAVIDDVRYTIGAYDTQSFGVAINDNNSIVGSIVVNNRERAFVWSPGEDVANPTVLPSLGGVTSFAYDINDRHIIVGVASDSSNTTRAVKWEENEIIDLGTLGGEISVARSINNANIVVGFAETINRDKHAFVHIAGKMYDLNDYVTVDEGWVIVDAYKVNEHGQILIRAQKNGSLAKEDNAYWILSPESYLPISGAEMTAGNGYCQWGQTDCEIIYPPLPVDNEIYQMPSGSLPIIPLSEIPNADAYVCNINCDVYSTLLPQYTTINEAIENTVNNATIVMLPGEYNESISLNFRKLVGLIREFTIINTKALNSRPVSLKGDTELRNIAITGGNALDGGGIQISGGNNLIDNCIVQGNTASRDGGGIHGLMYSSFTLKNSIISQNKARYGGGYVSWSYSNANIEHNKFLNNEAMYGAGVFIASYADIFFNANIVDSNSATYDGGGVYVNGYTRNKYVRNSLITNNYAGRYAGGVYRGGILGSVVYGNEAKVVHYSAILATISQNSIIWGNAGAYASHGIRDSIFEGNLRYCNYCSNVISLDPMFIDPENGNFRLREASPAIDNGADTSASYGQWQDDDFNGIKRGVDGDGQGVSIGNDYDIGAFEFTPSL